MTRGWQWSSGRPRGPWPNQDTAEDWPIHNIKDTAFEKATLRDLLLSRRDCLEVEWISQATQATKRLLTLFARLLKVNLPELADFPVKLVFLLGFSSILCPTAIVCWRHWCFSVPRRNVQRKNVLWDKRSWDKTSQDNRPKTKHPRDNILSGTKHPREQNFVGAERPETKYQRDKMSSETKTKRPETNVLLWHFLCIY
jgi:hypothetical protein